MIVDIRSPPEREKKRGLKEGEKGGERVREETFREEGKKGLEKRREITTSRVWLGFNYVDYDDVWEYQRETP